MEHPAEPFTPGLHDGCISSPDILGSMRAGEQGPVQLAEGHKAEDIIQESAGSMACTGKIPCSQRKKHLVSSVAKTTKTMPGTRVRARRHPTTPSKTTEPINGSYGQMYVYPSTNQ